jgi:3-hydroxyacyl-CoA dehydrogenase/enoyl-CoA hydratase/3-hydroxybutyryl-CoA epimerase
MEIGSDGIAVITLNDAGRSQNVVGPEFIEAMIGAIERIASDPGIRGAIITSAKSGFLAGADLKYIVGIAGGAISMQEAYEFSQRPSVAMHRRLETCGKPFVAAINGSALGGGLELALACHYRVIVDDPRVAVGLPEVTVGLLPGSGGTQRLPRMIGLQSALPLLLEGRTVPPAEAARLGIVERIVPGSELLAAARDWLNGTPSATRAWDQKGYRPSAGLLDPSVVRVMSEQPARIAARSRRNFPAAIAILECLYEGLLLPFDRALKVESRHFARLLCSPVARNVIRSGFVNRQALTKLPRRPPGVPKTTVRKVGVLGAGMMGSGIAYVTAKAGMQVVLLDRTEELAAAGKGYSVRLVDKAVQAGSLTREAADDLLSRITTTTSFADLADLDLVVEAVFEDVGIKADVTGRTEAVLPDHAIFASNTSTLPIDILADASRRPAQFVGLHFFSPVDRMPLVEVIVGPRTSQETLARALDFVGQLRYVPITVKDSRGFYTSRVFQTFILEGMKMLEEGIEPARIENAAQAAGFPVGPLALVDEVTVELPWKIVVEAEKATGSNYIRPCAYNVMKRMLEELKRPGRRFGAGFYEYPAEGPKRLWPGLASAFSVRADQPDQEVLKKRFLYVQAVETTRCFEEGVVSDAAEADLGALLGWGFPSWTGGPISLIDTVGLATFVHECDELAAACGPRFTPSAWLRSRAERNETFYPSAGSSEATACVA